MATQKNDLSLSVNVNADTSQVQKTLNHQTFKINAQIDIDTRTVQNRINNLFQSQRLEGFERINTTIRTGLSGLDDFGNRVTGLIKYTETFKNALGDVYERVSLTARNGNVLGQSLQKIQSGIANVTTETQKFNQEINGVNTSVTRVIKTTEDTEGKTKQVVKSTYEWVDAYGRLNTSVTTLDENGNQLAPTITTVSNDIREMGNEAETASNKLNILNGIINLLKREAIQMLYRAITEAINVVKDFDAAITEMGKVTDYSGEKLRNYTKTLGDLGKEVARTRTEMTEAATGWLKAGYSEEDAALLSKYSALLQNTADEELSASEATSILVSQLKAYHMEVDDAIKVTDIINKVSAEQAVSSYDISQGLTVASAAMGTFGNSIEETTALLTAGTTVFQGRSTQVARG